MIDRIEEEGETVFQDEVRGEVRWQNAIIDDLVKPKAKTA